MLPITHSPPDQSIRAIEIPLKVKQRLGLDDDRSWVVVSEWNEFIWPGPDLRRLPNSDDTSVAYGMLPPGLFSAIRDELVSLVKARTAHPVRRT